MRLSAAIGRWLRRLAYLVRRRAHEDELRREMDAHRAMLEQPRAFGDTLRLREQAREAWGWTWLDDLAQDARFALRTLRHSPGFTVTAVATLALGIGANIGTFSLVDGLLLRPLYDGSDEVVQVQSRGTTASGGYRGMSYPNYLDLREGTTDIFEDLAAVSTGLFVGLDVGEGARRTLASAVTSNYFQVLRQPLALGRGFTAEETRLDADIPVAIISHRVWEQRGADPGILGTQVRVDGEPVTVIGVAPEGFTGISIPGPDVWLPLGEHVSAARGAHVLGVVGRLREGTSAEDAATPLATVARRLEQAFPEFNAGYTLEMTPPMRLMFMPAARGAMTGLSLLLMVMPAIVLLVTCLNLADLLLARGQLRRQEFAIRSSLGGARWRLVRQLLTEGVLLALAGGASGLFLATWAADGLLTWFRPLLPVALSLPEVNLDWRVLAATVGFSVAASLVFGAWPAWALTGRTAVTDLKRQAGEEGRKAGGVRIGNALVIGQVALSILLLATGGLFLMSALSAATADPGFRLEGGLIVEVDPDLAGYNEARGRAVHLALVDRLRALPGVEAVTIGSDVPFSGFGDSRTVAAAGAVDAETTSVDAMFAAVGQDYARTLGLPMLAGRDFSAAELVPGSSERVAIVDDALAQRLWPGESAVGRSIQFLDAPGPKPGQPIRVVGVIPAVKHSLGNPQPFPHVYVPLGQHYESAMMLQLRVDEDAERAMLLTLARVVRGIDDRVPLVRLETWRDHLDRSIEALVYRSGARAFSAFGGIALLLAVIGVYGVKSYVVSRRTREFGIRLATGAQPRAVLWQVMREGGRVTAAGIGIGLLLAVGAGRLLSGILYGINSVEPVVLVAAPLILLAASLLASYFPARRATKVDPTVALRAE